MQATLPATFAAGDRLDFTVGGGDFPATDGWTLKYRLVPRVSGTAITLTASTSGSDYAVLALPATTAAWGVGAYGYEAWVEKTGYRTVTGSGQISVTTDPTTITVGTDTRTQAEIAVAALKAAMATYTASQGHIAEYEIAGRRMKFSDKGEIVALLSFWNGELSRENALKAQAMGLADPRRIYLRAGRA